MLFAFINFLLGGSFFLTGYVSGCNSFPHPLSPDEEEHYLSLYKQGDQDAKNILIERNLRLVAHIAKKYSLPGQDMDDLISIGTIGLIKAITSYDSGKKTRLATYAARCIDNEILMVIRSSKKLQNEVSLQDPIGFDNDGNEVSLIDVLGSDHDDVLDMVEYKLQTKRLENDMNSLLKGRERLVLQLRYGLLNGCVKTQREIAKQLGISRSYVSRIEKKAISKLSKQMVDG